MYDLRPNPIWAWECSSQIWLWVRSRTTLFRSVQSSGAIDTSGMSSASCYYVVRGIAGRVDGKRWDGPAWWRSVPEPRNIHVQRSMIGKFNKQSKDVTEKAKWKEYSRVQYSRLTDTCLSNFKTEYKI